MESSDKENDENCKSAQKIKSESDDDEFDSDFDENVSRKNFKRKKVYKVIESDDSDENNDCAAKVDNEIFNYARLLDSYESPNLNVESFELEEINNVNGVPMVLDTDIIKNEDIVVHPKIVAQLKPHQIDGLMFMFKSCYNDLNTPKMYRDLDKGCIVAHCMGLGKTFQLIALLHTVIRYPQLKTQKILVICPKSTVLNWKAEIDKWLKPIKGGRKLNVFTFPEKSSIEKKIEVLKEWFELDPEYEDAGCLLLGYEAFMKIVFYSKSKKINRLPSEVQLIEKNVSKYLLKPGADLVVLDEGHRIKNLKTTTSKAINQIMTKRRIILTGTPMQNNLKEYYSMVNFIKPDFLGSKADFSQEYAIPIQKGQHKDSELFQVREMVEKSFILHRKLSDFVQRRDVTVLKEFLPEKFEYDIFIPMTDIQMELYDHYLQENPLKDGKNLLPDYHTFRKIWSHPKVLEIAHDAAWNEHRRKYLDEKSDSEFGTDDEGSEYKFRPDGELILNTDNGDEKELKMYSPLHDWWKLRITQEQLDSILSSNKLKILFEILKICERENEKCLIFSEYTKVLDVVEMAMKQITKKVESNQHFNGLEDYDFDDNLWKRALDYYRMDGSTSQSDRHDMINRFNNPNEKRLRAFLISSKAGGQGINLTGATRVVMLDTSWNPSNDQQSIFRVFRLGQQKKCYIYRLLAMGTMEEKVYSRSVTKQATSCRVVDKQQIERHYNMAELIELYTLTKPDPSQRPVPNMPSDKLLAYLLHKYPEIIYKFQEHDSLLEEVEENVLNEEEKENLWLEYKLQAIDKAKQRKKSSFMSDYDKFSEHFRGNTSDEKLDDDSESCEFGTDNSSNPSPLRPTFNVNTLNTAIPSPIDQKVDHLQQFTLDFPTSTGTPDSAAKKRKIKKPKSKVKQSAKKPKRSLF